METRIFNSSSATTGAPHYAERSGQTVEIVRPLTRDEADEEVGPMFLIRFQDGVEANAFDDELSMPTKLVGIWVLACTPQCELMKWGLGGGTEFPYPPDQEAEALAQAKYLDTSTANITHSIYILHVFDNGQMKQHHYTGDE